MVSDLLSYGLGILGAICVHGFFRRVYEWIVRPSPFALLPGPESPSWLWGHLTTLKHDEDYTLRDEWAREYGCVVAHRGRFNVRPLPRCVMHLFVDLSDLTRQSRRVLVTDLGAISHIISHSDVYQKTPEVRRELARLLGEGVLVAEGQAHRRQRRALNPAFGSNQLRELSSEFLNVANKVHVSVR
jgi:cytochrome P450